MTTTLTSPDPTNAPVEMSIQQPQLPRFGPHLAAGIAIAAAALIGVALGWGLIPMGVLAGVMFTVALPAWSYAIEGSRKAVDRLVSSLVWGSFILAMAPLVSLLWTVISKGLGILSVQFFTYSMRSVIGEGGGIYHAIIGTVLITAGAAAISVPIGVLAAIYLVEYGKGNRMAQIITFLVDVMTGIPSIVAGLFAYALFSLIFDPSVRMGFGGSVALSVLMIPIVVRATEEMLKLVPDDLREASTALGVPKWRTIMKVVVPTALAGIVTGVTLAIARVAGETAPLLIIAGNTTSSNFNLFDGRMATLPVFIFNSVSEPGRYIDESYARAWGAALVLITIVMILNIVARIISKAFAPKTGR